MRRETEEGMLVRVLVRGMSNANWDLDLLRVCGMLLGVVCWVAWMIGMLMTRVLDLMPEMLMWVRMLAFAFSRVWMRWGVRVVCVDFVHVHVSFPGISWVAIPLSDLSFPQIPLPQLPLSRIPLPRIPLSGIASTPIRPIRMRMVSRVRRMRRMRQRWWGIPLLSRMPMPILRRIMFIHHHRVWMGPAMWRVSRARTRGWVANVLLPFPITITVAESAFVDLHASIIPARTVGASVPDSRTGTRAVFCRNDSSSSTETDASTTCTPTNNRLPPNIFPYPTRPNRNRRADPRTSFFPVLAILIALLSPRKSTHKLRVESILVHRLWRWSGGCGEG